MHYDSIVPLVEAIFAQAAADIQLPFYRYEVFAFARSDWARFLVLNTATKREIVSYFESVAPAKYVDGEKISRLRRRAKLSQRTAAQKAGICTNYLCWIEQGRTVPSRESVAAIAKLLGCRTDELYTGDD